jgi:hypothetical protein
MRGSISKRGKRSWRIRFDVERAGGHRKVHYCTVRGTRKDAEAELARLLHEANTGTRLQKLKPLHVKNWLRVDPSKLTVAEEIRRPLPRYH